jgi:hypothetical protein
MKAKKPIVGQFILNKTALTDPAKMEIYKTAQII